MERKKELAEAGVLVDLSFDAKTKEQITILALIRSGSLSFLGNDFKDLLLKIFDDDENKKDEIQHLCNYLENEQKKLMKLF